MDPEKNRYILKGDSLKRFKNAYIIGSSFLASDIYFYHEMCGLSPGVSLALKRLADEVRYPGKFIPRT